MSYESYRIVCGEPVVRRIVRRRIYEVLDSGINLDDYPKSGSPSVPVDIQLVPCGSGEQILAKLEKENLRPATLWKLLCLGDQHPELLKRYRIIALGSIFPDSCGIYSYMPCVTIVREQRVLYRVSTEAECDAEVRFAAESKQLAA